LDLEVLISGRPVQYMRTLALMLSFAAAMASSQATTLQKLDLGEMTQQSTAIVRAKVTGTSGILRGNDVYTVYRLEILESLKSSAGRIPQEVAVPGGVAGGLRQIVAGAPALRTGQEYVMFLWTSRSGLTQLIGLSQGLFAVNSDGAAGEVVKRPAAEERMLDRTGRPVRDEAISMKWSELKAKVNQALAAGLVAGEK
jgi:hypothetical protein